MKILFIDDNQALIDSLKDYLGDGWSVTPANTGYDGIKLAKNGKFDIIILDLNLPDIGGREVCRALRKADIAEPVIVLSAIGGPDSKVSLFQAGADDYVTKPFDIKVFQARLEALSRRGRLVPAGSHLLKAGGLVLDPLKRQVQRDGNKISLRRKEFDILEYLLLNRGRIVTRTMIMDSVWEGNSSSWNNTVDVHIKHLRDKVDRPYRRHLIQTAYGVGYTIKEQV